MNSQSSKSNPLKMLVLENHRGEAVRTLHSDQDEMNVVHRLDSGRVEFWASLEDLQRDEIPFELIAKVNLNQMKANQPHDLGRGLKLIYTDSVGRVIQPVELSQDLSDQDFKKSLKRTAATLTALILLSFVINYFFPVVNTAPQPPTVVQIVLPEEPKPVTPPAEAKVVPTVTPTAKPVAKRRPPVQRKTVAVKRQPRKTQMAATQAPRRPVTIDRLGALAALDQTSARRVTGGTLNLRDLEFKNGSGGGSLGRAGRGGDGGSGRGGFSTAVAGQGLRAGQRGSGEFSAPSGGYGTRGKAGGQNGYGRTRLAGGGSGGFDPIEAEAEVSGGLDPDQIREVIQRNLGQILYCYEQGLQRQPALSGRMGVRFVINPQGRVSMASVSASSLRSNPVESCIVSKIRSFQFPRPVGGVNVKVLYPFQLQRNAQL